MAVRSLLCIDGGGVRGITSLVILDQLMYQLSPHSQVRPCEVFDIICGTGTGGIIAIMLGRLRMNVKDCLQAYHELSRQIFDQGWRPGRYRPGNISLRHRSEIETRTAGLTDAIRGLIETNLVPSEVNDYRNLAVTTDQNISQLPWVDRVPLLEEQSSAQGTCRVFVVSSQETNGHHVKIRSYQNLSEPHLDFSILEACLATTAVPDIFLPLSKIIGGCSQSFVHPVWIHTDPLSLLVQESRSVWPESPIGAVVSIGNGIHLFKEPVRQSTALLVQVARIISAADSLSRDFEEKCQIFEPDLLSHYFRLSGSPQLTSVAIDEWRSLPAIAQLTRTWMRNNSSDINKCVDRLKHTITSKVNKPQQSAVKLWEYELPVSGSYPPSSPVGSVMPSSNPEEIDLVDRRARITNNTKIQKRSFQAESDNDHAVDQIGAESGVLNNLSELQAQLTSGDASWPCEIRVVDPVDGNELNISFWRTVRVPEDGTVYNLPAGLGKFPLVAAAPFRTALHYQGVPNADLLIPMHDREAMYIEFKACRYEHSTTYSQRPFAVKPYVGNINAISGLQTEMSKATARGVKRVKVQARVGKRGQNEWLGEPPDHQQDYIVAHASIDDTSVKPQWLDGIASQKGVVKQFVSVHFGTGTSVEAQKAGDDMHGGIQLEIIPSYPLSRLRRLTGKNIRLHLVTLTNEPKEKTIILDQGALVFDLHKKISHSYGMSENSLHRFRLLFNGVGLEPLCRLSGYNITDDCKIHMIQKLRGGGTGSVSERPKRMALGAGGSISQNISRDPYPPYVWDVSRRKMINIQIINSNDFEALTGVEAPPTPISFHTYQSLGLPFFDYYLEDATAISGSFDDVLTVEDIAGGSKSDSTPKAENQCSLDSGKYSWLRSAEECNKCHENAPQKSISPCNHTICRACYQSISVQIFDGKPRSECPVTGCNKQIAKLLAFPHTVDDVQIDHVIGRVDLPLRDVQSQMPKFRSWRTGQSMPV